MSMNAKGVLMITVYEGTPAASDGRFAIVVRVSTGRSPSGC